MLAQIALLLGALQAPDPLEQDTPPAAAQAGPGAAQTSAPDPPPDVEPVQQEEQEAAPGPGSEPEVPEPVVDEPPSKLKLALGIESLPGDAEEWWVLVDELVSDIEARTRPRGHADLLYPHLVSKLRAVLFRHQGVIRQARSLSDPVDLEPAGGEEKAPGDAEIDAAQGIRTVGDLYASFGLFYAARLRLLEGVTPSLRSKITGLGVEGMEELKLELEFVRRHFRYQRLAIPEGLREVYRDLRVAPLSSLPGLFFFVLALIAFRAWRRWAPRGISGLQELLRSAKLRGADGFVEFLRYLDRARKPMEWLALFLVIFAILDVPEVPEPKGVIQIAVVWVLMAWLAVALLDAFATRVKSADDDEERSAARLKSMKILATWLVFLGMGLHLARHLAGVGTIHAWIGWLFELLAVPVALLLLRVWRPLVVKWLEREVRFSPTVRRYMERKRRRFGLIDTALAVVYFTALRLRRLMVELLRKSSAGRRLVAEALRQRMARSGAELEVAEEGPHMRDDLRANWLRGTGIVEAAIEDEVAKVLELIDNGWPDVTIVGERGGGKSALLRCLEQKLGDACVRVQIPAGGATAAWGEFLRALDLEEGRASAEAIDERLDAGIRVVLWDDVHRLSKPVLGGQAELQRFLERTAPWRANVASVLTVDAAAWEYIRPLRSGMISGSSTIEITAWTESQLGKLLVQRAEEVGVELDFRYMSFPRLLFERQFDSPEEGLRASYHRILWRESDGNPAVALSLTADSLLVERDGSLAVQLPNAPSARALEGASRPELFVLRFVIQTDGATLDEVVAGLGYTRAMIESALHAATMRGWTEERSSRYRVTWKWYRAITRVLVRRNLMGGARQRSEDDGENRDRRGARSGPGQGPRRPTAVQRAIVRGGRR